MAVVQLVIGYFRPALSAPTRKQWRWLHYGWGQLAMVAGAVNLLLGVTLLHDLHDASRALWTGVTVMLLAGWGVTGLVLEVKKAKVGDPAVRA